MQGKKSFRVVVGAVEVSVNDAGNYAQRLAQPLRLVTFVIAVFVAK